MAVVKLAAQLSKPQSRPLSPTMVLWLVEVEVAVLSVATLLVALTTAALLVAEVLARLSALRRH
jgi:hypothetical protein